MHCVFFLAISLLMFRNHSEMQQNSDMADLSFGIKLRILKIEMRPLTCLKLNDRAYRALFLNAFLSMLWPALVFHYQSDCF